MGLALYFTLILALFRRLVRGHFREEDRETKVVLGIVIGALGGLTIMSVFEAWWVAPGSPESAYFWSLAGVGLGLTQSPAYASNATSATSTPYDRAKVFYRASVLPPRAADG